MQSDSHTLLLTVGSEALFVLLAAMVASWNAELGLVLIALLFGLWLLWGISHTDQLTAVVERFVGSPKPTAQPVKVAA